MSKNGIFGTCSFGCTDVYRFDSDFVHWFRCDVAEDCFTSSSKVADYSSVCQYGVLCSCYCASYFDAVDKCKQIFNGVICQSVDELIGSGDAGIYSINEKAFVARVLEEVDNDSVIVNCPDDGSAFAYADDDANVLYRRNYADAKGESLDSKIIRHNLKNIATNESVQSIVERWNIRYVFQLTYSDGKGAFHTYKLDDWDGIQLINDSTEGFRLVEQEGDMRLYEIIE